MEIRWEQRVTNGELKVRASTKDLSEEGRRRRCNWTEPMLHMDHTAGCVITLQRILEGRRQKGKTQNDLVTDSGS